MRWREVVFAVGEGMRSEFVDTDTFDCLLDFLTGEPTVEEAALVGFCHLDTDRLIVKAER